jgi:hypothetical protein
MRLVLLALLALSNGGCLFVLAGAAAGSSSGGTTPPPVKEVAAFVAAGEAAAPVDASKATAAAPAALEAQGFGPAGWVVVRYRDQRGNGERLLQQAARAHGGELYAVSWDRSSSNVFGAYAGGSVTSVSTGWMTGGGGMPFASYGGGGSSGTRVVTGVMLGVLWRRGPPQPAPGWLASWSSRVADARARCSRGDDAACEVMVGELIDGKRPEVPMQERVRRCEAGDARSCQRLGDSSYLASGKTPQDYALMACLAGIDVSCARRFGGLDRERARVIALLQSRCEAGMVDACAAAHQLSMAAGDLRELRAWSRQRLYRLLKPLCDGGDGAACARVGNERIGEAGILDDTWAASFLARACSLGEAGGCVGGAAYQPPHAALRVLAPACAAHHRLGCKLLEDKVRALP